MKKLTLLTLLVAMCGTLSAQSAYNEIGQNKNYISTGMPILLIAPDAVSAALGDAGVASTPDAYSAHWNNAKFAFIEDMAGVYTTYTPSTQYVSPYPTGGLMAWSIITLLLCTIPGIVAIVKTAGINKCTTVEQQEQAIRSACRMLMETNCDCVKLEGGAVMAPTIKRMVDVGIPVMGHIGMTPQSATSFGGFKVQGGTPEGAKKLIQDAKALEAAGVFSIVLECGPSVVAKAVTEAVSVPILGIGAGPDVDCQVLVTQDLLGMYGDFKPKFVKQFAHIREEMVRGLNQFHEETLSGAFPPPEFSFNKQVEIPPLDD